MNCYYPGIGSRKAPIPVLRSMQSFRAAQASEDNGGAEGSDSAFELGCSERTSRTGGTGQAISYASTLDIPVFNIKHEHMENELIDFIADII